MLFSRRGREGTVSSLFSSFLAHGSQMRLHRFMLAKENLKVVLSDFDTMRDEGEPVFRSLEWHL